MIFLKAIIRAALREKTEALAAAKGHLGCRFGYYPEGEAVY
jgi:hypothetical protein